MNDTTLRRGTLRLRTGSKPSSRALGLAVFFALVAAAPVAAADEVLVLRVDGMA